tara:strand:+ start:72047 stop:73963 length:1917 start_codon:yes stop_codon:yes gene_type:complete
MQLKFVTAVLLGAASLSAQCNTQGAEIRTFDPWAVSFYYAAANGETLNQYVDMTVEAPVTVNQMFSTSYDQAAGWTGTPPTGTTPPDQVGNVAEVRIYTIAGSHQGNETTPASWTHVATAEMTIVAWNGDCVIQNFKDPVTSAPAPFTLPAGSYGLCVEYIPTSWAGTAALPQTNVPLLNPGSLSVIGFDPVANWPVVLQKDQFIELSAGGIQTQGWQVVDAAGVLGPFATPNNPFTDVPNLAFDYTPDPTSGRSESVGDGCYNLPFMIYEQIAENTTPIDLNNQTYTAILTPSANGGFYTITNGGIPYIAPPAGATNLTMGGTAAAPVANSSGNLDDCTFGYTMAVPLPIPSPGGGLMATEIGINSNGKLYFDTVAPTDTTFAYNGANYGSIAPFRDFSAQWALFNTDFDPMAGGDIYVMEPSPNLGGLMVWYDNVPNWPAVAGATNSMSIEFTPDGSVCNIAYGTLVANGSGDALVGFSAGNGEPVATPIDWSSIPAAPGAQVSGDGSSSPTLELSARPVASTTIDLVLGNLPAPAAPGVPRIGIFVLSTVGIPGGLDLGVIGMPGCLLYQNASILLTGFESAATPDEIRLPFTMPGPAWAGFDIYAQGAPLHAVLPPNALGITVSNGVCMTLGTQ